MISTFFTLTAPSTIATGIALWGLLMLIFAAELLDFKSSYFKRIVPHIVGLTSPLLVWFAFVVIVTIMDIPGV